MTSEAKDLVLRMLNHAQDKSIEELTAHITDIKRGLDDLRGSDLRSLIKYIFSVDINNSGYLDNVGNDFHKKIHGIYVQRMAGMNAIETRIKKDAPEISDEASMDIRIIKHRIQHVYKWIGATHSLQDCMENP